MSASEITEPRRLTLMLDPDLVLERVILRRVAGLKRKRGQDWLRSLLVHGFLAEGRLIRFACPGNGHGVSHQETSVPVTPFGNWLERANAPARHVVEPEPRQRPASAVTTVSRTEAQDKPFAHLRKVIG